MQKFTIQYGVVKREDGTVRVGKCAVIAVQEDKKEELKDGRTTKSV